MVNSNIAALSIIYTSLKPLFHNFAKWLNILLKYCVKQRKIFKVCLTILQHHEIKVFKDISIKILELTQATKNGHTARCLSFQFKYTSKRYSNIFRVGKIAKSSF